MQKAEPSIGDDVRWTRQRASNGRGTLNQTEFAALLGVSRRTVSRWESGDYAVERRDALALVGLLFTLGRAHDAIELTDKLEYVLPHPNIPE